MTSSDTLFTPAASTPIPLQFFASSSNSTVALSGAPDTPPLFSPITVPGHTPPAGSDPFSASPPSQFDQTPPTTAISLVSQANPNTARSGQEYITRLGGR
ncbi:hypothetical protein BJV78DRAFT_1283565 [Lactifluus subvellereus]|nr:hypothetical protein BJV78DRAFT_1283565 [Lactifluus subvellereus]